MTSKTVRFIEGCTLIYSAIILCVCFGDKTTTGSQYLAGLAASLAVMLFGCFLLVRANYLERRIKRPYISYSIMANGKRGGIWIIPMFMFLLFSTGANAQQNEISRQVTLKDTATINLYLKTIKTKLSHLKGKHAADSAKVKHHEFMGYFDQTNNYISGIEKYFFKEYPAILAKRQEYLNLATQFEKIYKNKPKYILK